MDLKSQKKPFYSLFSPRSPPIVQLVLTQTKMPVPIEARSEAISSNIINIDGERIHSSTGNIDPKV